MSGVVQEKKKERGWCQNVRRVVRGGGDKPHGTIVMCRISMFLALSAKL